MPVVTALVKRGVIFVPDSNPATIAEQRRINMQAPGHGARMSSHLQKYVAGQTAVLPESEARRLMAADIVEVIGVASS
jgi:hypothetical protein